MEAVQSFSVDGLDSQFVAELRRQMLRFAQLHLSDVTLAEDAVQEALLGALNGAQRFSGRSAIKTWVFAILKNKIADVLRHRQRMVDASSLLKEDEGDNLNDFFDANGHWLDSARPQGWDDPEATLEQRQFWAVFEACLEHLPAQQARAFMLREFMGFETDEICDQLSVSSANVFVLLHRARLRLRECLDQRWFSQEAA
jgi:RNA polymerase sigma-70 factor, ECF subfamily